MLGVGLGGFVSGFEKGMGLREDIDTRRKKRANEQAMQKIEDDTRETYDARVAAGDEKPDSYENFWMRYALPKRQAELLRQGDIEGAKKLEEWSTSDAAKQGQKLFASAMTKAMTGDPGGALDDAIKAAQSQGYINHDYELLGQDELRTEDGNLVGYRIRLKQGDREIEQDIAAEDVPRIVSTFANPDLAWQTQLDTRKAAEERKREKSDKAEERTAELEDYETKKSIDQKYDSPDYQKAYKDAFDSRLENDLEFADKSREEQDAIIRADLDARKAYETDQAGGAPSPGAAGIGQQSSGITPQKPGQKILIDTQTRQPVTASGVQKPVERRPQAAPAPDPNVAGLGKPAAAAPRQPAQSLEAVQEAKTAIAGGADPHEVRKQLVRRGIDPALLEQ